MKRTKEQMRIAADQIASLIVDTDATARWQLYTLVSERLRRVSHNFQANHFDALVKAETRGVDLNRLFEP